MKTLLMSLTMGFAFLAFTAHAQAPAAAPAGSTGSCKDGTYTSADSKKGACRGHKGVKEWYAAAPAAPAAASEMTTKKSSRASKADTADSAAASAPTAAPAGSTGVCKDGTYTSADAKKGACRGHKGVKEWYGSTAATPAPKSAPMAKPATPAPAPAPAPTAAPAPMPAPAPAPTPTRAAPQPAPTSTTAAAGGGNGKVWVNSETKVYHCPNDRYYGKTKQGEYMSEADAIAKGAHASHGKACTP